MTPQKEKAKELIDKFIDVSPTVIPFWMAQDIALIAVDEIIQLRKGYFDCTNPMNDENYWQQVKTEIENYERNKI